MDVLFAPLDKICYLAYKHDALVMIDECHTTGFIGKTGIVTLENKSVRKIYLITGALCKAMGDYTTAKKEVINILHQRSRPYLFSNSLLVPLIVGASRKIFDMLKTNITLRDKLEKSANYFKNVIIRTGFDIIDGDYAIVPANVL